jgi:hypothetical protein
MAASASAQIVLDGSATSLVRWVVSRDALPVEASADFLNRPSYSAARTLVNSLDRVLHVYVSAVSSVSYGKAQTVNLVLHTELPAVITGGWIRRTESISEDLTVGIAAKLRDWFAGLKSGGQLGSDLQISSLHPKPDGIVYSLPPEAISYLVVAGLDQWASELREESYVSRLAKIQASLGVRAAELARLLGVSREAIRRWFNGQPIASDRWDDIDRLERTVHQLAMYFREDLPALVRRRVPGLGGRTALDMMFAGRGDEVLGFYRRIFETDLTP